MPESPFPTTLTAPVSPPKVKKRRRELTNAHRVEIRQFFYDNSHTKPSQKEVIQWFEKEHYHTLTQSQVSKVLSDQYSFLDDQDWKNKGKNISADYPDLEDMLYHWEQAANRSGRLTVTGEILLRVEFLPANTTSICQPLDQGIIRTFKAHYKRRWLQYQLDNYEAAEDPHKKMNVLQALRWATEAWQAGVTSITIANCWLKSRVLQGQMTPLTRWKAQQMGWEEAVKQDEALYDQIVTQARDALKELENRQFIKEGQHIATFLNPPDEIIDDIPDNDQFIEQLAESYAKGPEIDPDAPETPIPKPISIPQALGALTTLRSFAEQQQRDHRDLIRQLGTLEREMKALQMSSRSQTSLERFFIAK